eukprot:109383-Chlamydomonas_euryale.AAC.4
MKRGRAAEQQAHLGGAVQGAVTGSRVSYPACIQHEADQLGADLPWEQISARTSWPVSKAGLHRQGNSAGRAHRQAPSPIQRVAGRGP